MVTKHHTKRYLRLSIFIVSLFILIPLISNQTVLAATAKQRIYDFAQLLSPEEVRNLEALAEKHSRKKETDFVVLTSNDADGKDIVKYMEDFYDENGLGYDKQHGNTVILTLDMGARDVYVAGFYKGEKFLDNQRSDLVRRKITPELSDGNYYKAFGSFIKTSSKYMGYRPGVNPNSPIFNIWLQLVLSLVVGGGVVGTMAYKSSGKMTVNEGTYRDPSHSSVIERRDDYIRTTTTKIKKPSNKSSGGGSGFGGGGGISGGGHSHSGSRGKF
ncbi:MAG TPA: hypothetical protein GX707_21180 [Epulopiscium sp.]|nr:hypothetical protein [Candidatus Epulonipiscium sp.]